jgi:hypothetical protein
LAVAQPIQVLCSLLCVDLLRTSHDNGVRLLQGIPQ